MATTGLNAAERGEVEQMVRKHLPGWKLSEDQIISSPASLADGAAVKRVGDIDALRKKFLGASGGALDPLAAPSDAAGVDIARRTRTVRVEPEGGGPAKVADIVDGRVTIVQG